MDGFAVRSGDVPGALRIAGEIAMGAIWTVSLPPCGAVRIPTGGVLPAGADAVVPLEEASVAGGFVRVGSEVLPGYCVTPAASDMRAGEVLLLPGIRLAGPQLGLLATLGISEPRVFVRPLFGIISSGDELVEPGATPRPGQVRDSNRYAIAGTLGALGAAARHYPTSADDPARLREILREAFAACDGVFITGGSSVGEKDHTPEAVEELGPPGAIVHGLLVKPGKPTLLAAAGGKPVIGLPGNPASAMMILEAVVEPIVAALTGARMPPLRCPARLGASLRKRPGWTWFVPVRLDEATEPAIAYPLELRSSSASLAARASGFIVLEEEIETLEAGAAVRVRRFSGS